MRGRLKTYLWRRWGGVGAWCEWLAAWWMFRPHSSKRRCEGLHSFHSMADAAKPHGMVWATVHRLNCLCRSCSAALPPTHLRVSLRNSASSRKESSMQWKAAAKHGSSCGLSVTGWSHTWGEKARDMWAGGVLASAHNAPHHHAGGERVTVCSEWLCMCTVHAGACPTCRGSPQPSSSSQTMQHFPAPPLPCLSAADAHLLEPVQVDVLLVQQPHTGLASGHLAHAWHASLGAAAAWSGSSMRCRTASSSLRAHGCCGG
jgi:hypothetical protein